MAKRWSWKRWCGLGIALEVLMLAAGCTPHQSVTGNGASAPEVPTRAADLTILSGSENMTLEPLIQDFARLHHVSIQMNYAGSVEIMRDLQGGQIAADAVWPANSFWISLGDSHHQVKQAQSIMRTPVVFGVKKSVAARLGWVGKPVTVERILQAAEADKLRYMMTSATQSNSGVSAYLGYLSAFAGRPETLTSKDLTDPQVQGKIKRILGTINRSSGSSGWLKDLFIANYDRYDAMVNYESVIIETDQQLVAQGKEPLYVIYPEDGLALADSPLGYVDKGDADKAKLFGDLQHYLLSPTAQKQILAKGRRVGLLGLTIDHPDTAVFNPDWGINTRRVLSPIRFPDQAVVAQALDLYQTTFRKPSLTVYCVDFSGSMTGNGGEAGVKNAMHLLLDQDKARSLLLQAAPTDITIIIPFNSQPLNRWTVRGNDPAALHQLTAEVDGLQADGGTDIYTPVIQGLDLLKQTRDLDKYFPAIILMTDGQSNTGATFADLQAHLAQSGLQVPVFAIAFGGADKTQLGQITGATSGKLFDGSRDLGAAFREAKGYN